MDHHSQRRPAFTLIELLVVIAIVAVIIALVVPALLEARRAGRIAVCQSNLRQFGQATGTYSIDFHDRIWSFTWSRDECPTDYDDLLDVVGNIGATASQAVDIIRRNSPIEPDFPRTTGWIPAVDMSHLVLLDYLARRLPEPMVACPEDQNLRHWQADIPGFNQGAFGPNQPPPTGVFRAAPYSSSYEVNPASYDPNTAPITRIHQADNQFSFVVNLRSKFGNVRLSTVAFPAQKVHIHEGCQRHFDRPIFYAIPAARIPLLFFDASVAVRRTRDANPGWDPWDTTSAAATQFWYQPTTYGPPTSNGEPREWVTGYYRWTRGGLGGIDFGGREISTGQPALP